MAFMAITLPLWAMVALGLVMMRSGLLPAGTPQVLNAFAFWVALPALVLGAIASQPLTTAFEPNFFAGMLTSGGVVFAAVWLASRRFRPTKLGTSDDAATHAIAATVSNLGYLGLPLALTLFGPRAAGPMAMAILTEVAILLSIGMVLAGRRAAGGTAPGSSVHAVLRSALTNPVLWAIAIGLLFSAQAVPLPSLVQRLVAFVGPAAGPAALFALGGLMVQWPSRATWSRALALAAAKLALYPALAWLMLALVFRLEPFWVQVGTLIAALPPAATSLTVAQREGSDVEGVAAAIVVATALACITWPLLAWWLLGAAPGAV
jgi:hypothetical protein